MWQIITETERCKTFKLETVFNFILKSESKTFDYYFNYLKLTKGEFLKLFLNTSGDYEMYLQLETKLISEKSRELWEKDIKI